MTEEEESGKGECNLPEEPVRPKVLHLKTPKPSKMPLNNPLPCKASVENYIYKTLLYGLNPSPQK